MRYDRVTGGVFLSRLSRFSARAIVGGREQTVHVKNTGRLRELLIPGAEAVLCPSDSPGRKTAYDLVVVRHDGRYVNIDSQAPNAAAAELMVRLYPGCALRRERVFGSSRFDLFLEREELRLFTEVKGVTLVRDGTAFFPDAPTERGRKHLLELAQARSAGYAASVLFLVQRDDALCFSPNRETDPAFADALAEAAAAGVEVLCFDCEVTADSMTARSPVPVKLN
ncbi:MAG: DNA/RNA nuclease SfsA [Oscillospiraceae bacterium]|nr:DNA/RNA nuclease SfsA [Oscillospiraceae bacterium]